MVAPVPVVAGRATDWIHAPAGVNSSRNTGAILMPRGALPSPTREMTRFLGVKGRGPGAPPPGRRLALRVAVGAFVRVTLMLGVLDGVGLCDGVPGGVAELLGVLEGVGVTLPVRLLVEETVAVDERVALGVTVAVMEPELLAPTVLLVVGEGVWEGVLLAEPVALGVLEGVAVAEEVAVVVALAVAETLGVLVGVFEGSDGVSAMPRNIVFARDVTMGAPPFVHDSVAVLKPYTADGVVAYNVKPSLCSAAC